MKDLIDKSERNKIKEFLRRCDGKRIPVISIVGDIMVDEYYYVDANKISPEFPILAFTSKANCPSVVVPGGAANVAMQFRHFKFYVQLFGFIDAYSKMVLNNSGVDTSNCVDLPRDISDDKLCATPVKKRFYNKNFPLFRWDVEAKNCGLVNLQEKQQELYDKFCAAPEAEVVVFSDYNKGVFSEDGAGATQWAMHECDSIKIVDPKNGPIQRWRGCHILKPNKKEAAELTQKNTWQSQVEHMRARTGCLAAIITDGGNGVKGEVPGRGKIEYKPLKKSDFRSVIGAGDCFVAFLAMSQSHCMDIMDGAEVAYEAGSIYIQNKHNLPITPYEFIRHIDPVGAKFNIPQKPEELVFTNGCFDFGLTVGHIECLKFAKLQGGKLVVAINSDNSVKNIKGESRPVLPLKDRMHIVASLECVDYVVSFEEDTPLELIRKILPKIIVKGGDYKPEEVIGHELAEVRICPYHNSISTTGKLEEIG